LPTPAFFYGLEPNEEIIVEIDNGKNILIKYLNISEPTATGNRVVFFKLNGQDRAIEVKDQSLKIDLAKNRKVSGEDKEIGAPLQGSLSTVLVKAGDKVDKSTPLFIIEAMKMESTITSPVEGTVKKVHLSEKTLVEQDDLVIELA